MPHPVKLTRYEGNPILEARPENSWEAQNVANAGAVMHDGKVHILYRAEGFEKREPRVKQWPVTRLGLAVAADGFHVDERPAVPVLGPEPPGSFAEHGVQDPRIALIDGTYYLTLSGVSRWGNRTLLYATENFRTYRKIGDIQPEFDMHSCGLFPARFGGRYAMLLRYLPNLWLAYTRDFKTWEPSRLLFETRKHSWYGQKLGIGATPIRQDDAWLLFWHGKADTLDGTYSPPKSCVFRRNRFCAPNGPWKGKAIIQTWCTPAAPWNLTGNTWSTTAARTVAWPWRPCRSRTADCSVPMRPTRRQAV